MKTRLPRKTKKDLSNIGLALFLVKVRSPTRRRINRYLRWRRRLMKAEADAYYQYIQATGQATAEAMTKQLNAAGMDGITVVYE
jgi:hypothetical protein